MNEEQIREQVSARDSLEEALGQSRRAQHFAVNMARTVGTLADAIERVQAFCDRMQVETEDGSRADTDTVWPSDVLAVLRGEEPSV